MHMQINKNNTAFIEAILLRIPTKFMLMFVIFLNFPKQFIGKLNCVNLTENPLLVFITELISYDH